MTGTVTGPENLLFLDKVHPPSPLPPASPGLHLQICTHQQSLDVAAVGDANEDNDSDIKYVLSHHPTPPPHHPRILCQYNIRDYCSK